MKFRVLMRPLLLAAWNLKAPVNFILIASTHLEIRNDLSWSSEKLAYQKTANFPESQHDCRLTHPMANTLSQI